MSANQRDPLASGSGDADWDHSSHQSFFEYYAEASLSPQTLARYGAIRDVVLRFRARHGAQGVPLEVADIGCGAGTQCLMWADLGHHVHGIDVNEPLLELGRTRASAKHHEIDFKVGSAVALPWDDESMDVCLVPELLEHVREWEACLAESTRILRPGGLLFVSTTNKLCPKQQEFNLLGYSWYPAFVKRHCESLAVTTRPALANFAKYPAVNWFSFYSLRDTLALSGLRSYDRFDLMDLTTKGAAARWVVAAIRAMPPLRFLAHVATPATFLLAVKEDASVRA